MGDENKGSGVVKMLNPIKGYGLIDPDDGGEELFFHVTSIKKISAGVGVSLSIGVQDKVEFDVKKDDKGRRMAVNITGPNGGPLLGVGGRDRYQIGASA